MAESTIKAPPARRPLRLWPGVTLAIVLLLLRYVAPEVARLVAPDYAMDVTVLGMLGGIVIGLLILLWWLFFSRAAWSERLGALVLMAVVALVVRRLLDPSIATAAMGVLYAMLLVPILGLAFVAWAYLTRHRPDGVRRLTLVAVIVAACASLTLIRTGGFSGDFKNDFAWRWSPTPEERLLAAEPALPAPARTAAPPAPTPVTAPGPASPPTAAPAAVAAATPVPAAAPPPVAAASPATPAPAAPVILRVEWPGFRGPGRDGIVSGSHIATDWASTPPVALWRRAVGPGWSSFAVAGDRFYTQEQRGEDEVVASYNTATGEPVWQHRDHVRFWESNAGAGPRGTPLIHGGRIYALGGKGTLNALDAATGAVAWTRDAAADTKAAEPMWGFAGSPIVAGELLIVPVSGRLAAYDLATGTPRWKAGADGDGYTSPQLVTIRDVPQILFVNGAGLTSVAPGSGAVLWSHAWKGYPIVQPAVTADGDVLFAVNESSGVRRLAIQHDASGWTTSERWTSNGLKPYFNDFVVHKGHAYGFDGGILSCIDLADGTRKWKGGRYGHGQLVLLADQDALLVLAEEGDIALVRATPAGFAELGKVAGLDGKTWNHPVVVGDRLLVRNGEQMAAFRLPPFAPR